MIAPTVHLNGTGREELERQLRVAYEALGAALVLMADAAPHGRDYYPQGTAAYLEAALGHQRRVKAVSDSRDELLQIFDAIQEATR